MLARVEQGGNPPRCGQESQHWGLRLCGRGIGYTQGTEQITNYMEDNVSQVPHCCRLNLQTWKERRQNRPWIRICGIDRNLWVFFITDRSRWHRIDRDIDQDINIGRDKGKMPVFFVFLSCHNKTSHTEWLAIAETYFLTVLETASLRWGCQHSQVLVRTLSWLENCCLFNMLPDGHMEKVTAVWRLCSQGH